jgi:predicted DNA-binding transcriptional regulator AlpA
MTKLGEDGQKHPGRIWRWKQLKDIVPLCRVTIWQKVQTGEFPEPVRLSARATGWREEDVRAWMKRLKPRDV